jgi:Terpene synthase family 2, C-terminal metal binding
MAAVPTRYLATLCPAERDRVLDVAGRVSDACEAWLADYPIVQRPSVTAACSLVSAIGMPSLAVPELALMTRWWLWIFGVDDRFDDLERSDAEVVAWSRRFFHALRRPPRPQQDLLLAAFGSIRDDLADYPLFQRLRGAWQRGMWDIVEGMLVERRWSAGLPAADAPDYATYLDNAMRTISMRPYTVTTCVVAGDVPAAADFARLEPLVTTAARCFRLANDLRSEARERAEGKLNAVTLVQRELVEAGLAVPEAAQSARSRLSAACAEDLALLDRQRTAVPATVATLATFLHSHSAFVCDLYAEGDYDSVSEALRASGQWRLARHEV